MQLYFIRHAQSINNALGELIAPHRGRSEDPDLTELGVHQAEALAQYLKTGYPRGGVTCPVKAGPGFGITHIYSSLMIRAVKTGTIVSKVLGIPLEGILEIHERGGIYLVTESGVPSKLPGKDRAYFEENFPGLTLPKNFIDTGWWNNQVQESPQAYPVRAKKFLNNLIEKHGKSKDKVAVIGHAGIYNDVLAALMNLPPDNMIWFSLFNTGITRIDFHEDLYELVYQNRTDHLSPDMIT